jgi:predicted Zn-dependent protease
MVYGEDPRQGYVEGQTFYHPELKFQFPIPSGWALQNSPVQVLMYPEDGRAMMIFTLSQQETLEDAASTTIQELELNLLDSKKTTVNGMPAIATYCNQVSQNQQTGLNDTIDVLSYFISYNGLNYVFHGVAGEADFKNYVPVFEPTMTRFNTVTNSSVLNRQPQRVRIRKVQRPGTLAEAFRSFRVPQEQMEKFAFLNNMELTDRVEAGKLLKIAGD